jgi:hypothetical protein
MWGAALTELREVARIASVAFEPMQPAIRFLATRSLASTSSALTMAVSRRGEWSARRW